MVFPPPDPQRSARRAVRLEEPFVMRHGGMLPEVTIAYESWGRISPTRDNVLLLFTGLSPSAHAASSEDDPAPGWWDEMIGPGKPIDTDRFHVICVNSLGSCFGSTGPASIDPRTGARYRTDFPVLAIEDIARAAHNAMKKLGIERLRAVAGSSMGGMTSLAYAVLYPDQVDGLITISAATRADPFAIAIRSLQREAIRRDPAWKDGRYEPNEMPEEGMRLARKIGMLSYRSRKEWRQRFGRERVDTPTDKQGPFGIEFEVEAYLEAHARKFVGTFDANCYLYLSRSMDLFDLAEHGGSVEAGLGRIRASRSLVIGVETDVLYPLDQQREIATTLRNHGRRVRFEPLPSIQGHDAFLIDHDRFGPVISEFLGSL